MITEFKRHFFYKEDKFILTDSWIKINKNGTDLIDLRDSENKPYVLLEYFIGKKNKRIMFENRKEGLKFIKKKWGLK